MFIVLKLLVRSLAVEVGASGGGESLAAAVWAHCKPKGTRTY